MFELRFLSASYGLICVLKGLYYFYMSLIIMTSIGMLSTGAATIFLLIEVQNVALVMMGLIFINAAISSHLATPHNARSIITEALPTYLFTLGFTQLTTNILSSFLLFPGIPFSMFLYFVIDLTYIFMAMVLTKFGQEHFQNQLYHAPNQELNHFLNQLGFSA